MGLFAHPVVRVATFNHAISRERDPERARHVAC
jgi:hypothetical protein